MINWFKSSYAEFESYQSSTVFYSFQASARLSKGSRIKVQREIFMRKERQEVCKSMWGVMEISLILKLCNIYAKQEF